MKCPPCGYIHGCSSDSCTIIAGSWGDFFYLPVEIVRRVFGLVERKRVIGCPSCNKLFMDLYN
jgi:hypothetical protein